MASAFFKPIDETEDLLLNASVLFSQTILFEFFSSKLSLTVKRQTFTSNWNNCSTLANSHFECKNADISLRNKNQTCAFRNTVTKANLLGKIL